MRIRDYLRGYRVVIQSRLRADEVQRRINAATISSWPPFASGVAGWAHFGRIRLRYRPGFFDYNAGPILAGRIADELGPTQLRLRFRAPLPACFFFAIWYGFFSIFLIVFLLDGAASTTSTADLSTGIGMFLVFLIAPIVIHYVGTRKSDAYFEKIITFLEDVAEAKRMSGPGWPAAKTIWGRHPNGMPAPPS